MGNVLKQKHTDKKIIWDSGYGYDVGYLVVKLDKPEFNNCDTVIRLASGVTTEIKYNMIVQESEVIDFTEENRQKMIEKYYSFKKEFKF